MVKEEKIEFNWFNAIIGFVIGYILTFVSWIQNPLVLMNSFFGSPFLWGSGSQVVLPLLFAIILGYFVKKNIGGIEW